ncbi:hypothetical protein SH1V18_38710 [Vallitalea longa]|uniref:Uncharacterized protein n=1 Tax=Vallitalea longa TaxID=2936439 RepID=A0A9W5YET5_9FIRM|nr:hypothetical protein [Vallitalea longa]GKX31391.1 hypothetical protein SH1V18_38710 [Vallitalea longa]
MLESPINKSKAKEKYIKIIKGVLATIYIFFACTMPVHAQKVKDSKLVTGTEKLINDITIKLIILAPIISGLLIIYFCIRRSAADEMDVKKWNNRITTAIVSCIGAVLGSALINLIVGYYK